MSEMQAAQRWRDELAEWAIPQSILDQAPQSPWIHPPVLFDIPQEVADSPSHRVARAGLGKEGSVLDVGCGGGIAAFALAPDVRFACGVDHQPEMLEMFQRNGLERGIATQVIEGFWPDVAEMVPYCDVATAHHVVYNVGQIEPFLSALAEHATCRVVIEMPQRHPLANLTPAWEHFWGITRPSGPTPELLAEIITELGFEVNTEFWSGPMRTESNLRQAAEFTTIRLCLPSSRIDEVEEFLAREVKDNVRELVTLWWEK